MSSIVRSRALLICFQSPVLSLCRQMYSLFERKLVNWRTFNDNSDYWIQSFILHPISQSCLNKFQLRKISFTVHCVWWSNAANLGQFRHVWVKLSLSFIGTQLMCLWVSLVHNWCVTSLSFSFFWWSEENCLKSPHSSFAGSMSIPNLEHMVLIISSP